VLLVQLDLLELLVQVDLQARAGYLELRVRQAVLVPLGLQGQLVLPEELGHRVELDLPVTRD